MRKVLAAAIVVLTLSACQTMKSETFYYTSTNVPGNFWFHNRTPTSFPITLSGKLHLPEGEGPFPVVVWGPPTTRNSDALAQWRHDLRSGLTSEGVGIFFNDSYTGRNLPRRVTAKHLNSASRYVDGVRILDALAEHPKIDPKRIGISGASYGANIAMRLQWEDYMSQIQPNGLRYAAHVPIYPPCNAIIKNYKSTGAPMLILIGEKDYNDSDRCKARVEELRDSGAQVDLIVYPNAYHCFIASFPPRMVNTPVYRDCGTKVIDKSTGYSMRINAKSGYPGCINPQGMCGGNWSAANDALERTITFFVEHLRK